MAGILDQNAMSDPQTQGLLQAAFAALQASGPSRMPVSFGQALGQAGSAGVAGYDAGQQARLRDIQAQKAKLDLELQKSLQEGTGGGVGGLLNDPDRMEAVGTKLALQGHPGGAALINAAEKIRAKRSAAAQFATMKQTAQTVQPDPQENAIAADQGTPAVEPATVQKGGLFAGLMNSPHVGQEAGLLQSQLNAAPNADPKEWMGHYERLATAHRSAQEHANAALERAANLPKSTVIVADKTSPTGWSHRDTRTDEVIPGAPPPVGAAQRAPAGYRMTADGNLERIPIVGGNRASDDALTNDAWYQIINGKARPGSLPLGRDEGNKYREALREKTAQIAKEIGLSPQQLATLGPENKSKFMALNAVEKDLAAIRPFDAMLDTNAKIAIDLGKKISENRTNSQILNKPITWVQQNAADNPDIAEYLFQIQTVRTEGARILNNPRLVGQLTDSARHEMGDVVNGNMPLGQVTRVLERMMSDGKNRVRAIEEEATRLRSDIRGSAEAPKPKVETPASPPSASQIDELLKKYGRKP